MTTSDHYTYAVAPGASAFVCVRRVAASVPAVAVSSGGGLTPVAPRAGYDQEWRYDAPPVSGRSYGRVTGLFIDGDPATATLVIDLVDATSSFHHDVLSKVSRPFGGSVDSDFVFVTP